jgi:hypothetical protein
LQRKYPPSLEGVFEAGSKCGSKSLGRVADRRSDLLLAACRFALPDHGAEPSPTMCSALAIRDNAFTGFYFRYFLST